MLKQKLMWGKLTWPNQNDQMNMTKIWWTWPTLRQRWTLFIEFDYKIGKYYDNDQPKSVNMTEIETNKPMILTKIRSFTGYKT